MTEQERKKLLHLADMIEGEINRICVTMSGRELFKMHHHLQNNIDELVQLKCKDIMSRQEESNDH